jgi:hypothetical protein
MKAAAKHHATNNRILPHRRTAKKAPACHAHGRVSCRSQQSNPASRIALSTISGCLCPQKRCSLAFWPPSSSHCTGHGGCRHGASGGSIGTSCLAVGRRNSGSASTVWRRRECQPIKGLRRHEHDRRLSFLPSARVLSSRRSRSHFSWSIFWPPRCCSGRLRAQTPRRRRKQLPSPTSPVCEPPFGSRSAGERRR